MGEVKSIIVRRILSIITVMAFVGILFAQEVAVRHVTAMASAAQDTLPQRSRTPQRRRVDFMADMVRPYSLGEDSVVYLVGNFAAHHNGAVISCDSAVRYSDTRWGFFSRLLINQDSIYIYGDSAIYDGDAGVAEIYAPIVKVVDGDALLYTYNFSFNTQTRVGSYTGGGVLVHDDNIIESQRGYYYSEGHDVVCVEQVELHGAEYDMKSDSIIYNTDTELARFFTSSEIWNADGDYLSADAGLYDKSQDLYMVTRNGYILTADQEVWGDTLSYYRTQGYVEARGNLQMDDFKQKMMAFGDYAEYWQEPGDMLLTRRPSVMSYDLSRSDTVYMSADTILVRTISLLEERRAAERAKEEAQQAQSKPTDPASSPQRPEQSADANKPVTPSAQQSEDRAIDREPQGEREHDVELHNEQDTTLVESQPADTLSRDSVVLTPKQIKAQQREQIKQAQRKIKEQQKAEKAAERKIKLDSIARKRQAKITAMLNHQRDKELARQAKDSVRRAERRAKLLGKGRDVSALDREDSLAAVARERLLRGATTVRDSVKQEFEEAPIEDTVAVATDSIDSISADSVYRLLRAYRGVKMFRKDAQMVCDSLISSSLDSIVYLYVEPVLWSGANQLIANEMRIFTKNQQLERAEFMGDPIMVADVDGTYYNQVTGKKMIAFFREGELYRNDVEGNVQTLYFRTIDEQSKEVAELTYLESASASFYLEDQQLVGITYRNEIPFSLYPIGLVPATQATQLPNFKWIPERRPALEEVLGRELRPSQRDAVAERKRPTFSIVERMDRRKEALLLLGEWSDREDELSPEIAHWRDTRGM